MSLINDALKKAQRQRTGETPVSPPTIHSRPPHAPVQPEAQYVRHAPARSHDMTALLIKLGVGGAILAAIVFGVVWLLRPTPPSSSTASPVVATTPPPSKVEPVQAAPAQLQDPVPAPAPVQAATPAASTLVLPTATTPVPTVVVETPAPRPEPVKPVAPVLFEPVVAKVEPAAAPAVISLAPATAEPVPTKLPPVAIQYIENLRIAGIRASTTDSKVLMNDRVYRIGDTVEYQLGLRLVEIAPGRLTFENDHGIRYTRLFR